MAEKNKSANVCEGVEGESILNVMQDSLVSVSYTHLDVYKRQVYILHLFVVYFNIIHCLLGCKMCIRDREPYLASFLLLLTF